MSVNEQFTLYAAQSRAHRPDKLQRGSSNALEIQMSPWSKNWFTFHPLNDMKSSGTNNIILNFTTKM